MTETTSSLVPFCQKHVSWYRVEYCSVCREWL